MSAAVAAGVRSWPVGAFTATMTIPTPKPGSILSAAVEWSPTEPSRLSGDEWRQYRLGRNKAIAELAAELGINVALLEL